MYLSKEKFEKIKAKYSLTIVCDDDIMNAFDFVREVLEAEADEIEKQEPYAINCIKNINKAAETIFDLSQEIEI